MLGGTPEMKICKSVLRHIDTSHAVPLPCCSAKGLDVVFPIWFTQCGHVWFTHGICELASAVQGWHVSDLPMFGTFREWQENSMVCVNQPLLFGKLWWDCWGSESELEYVCTLSFVGGKWYVLNILRHCMQGCNFLLPSLCYPFSVLDCMWSCGDLQSKMLHFAAKSLWRLGNGSRKVT
jgi:hypothetical protein